MNQLEPVVTIGIPTFKRPDLLDQTLNHIFLQTYKNIKVIISNNEADLNLIMPTVNKYKKLLDLDFCHQEKNIGLVNNFLFLLEKANSEYFMYLADDDEISDNFVESLVTDLNNNTQAVCVVPYWNQSASENTNIEKIPSHFPSKNIFLRVIRYVWKSDDAFHYGLHRLKYLKNCKYISFWWPNRDSVPNWAYPYLFSLIIQGPIILTANPKCIWYQKTYTKKLYRGHEDRFSKKNKFGTLLNLLVFTCKRMNVYLLYIYKIFLHKKFFLLPIVIVVAFFALLRDIYEN